MADDLDAVAAGQALGDAVAHARDAHTAPRWPAQVDDGECCASISRWIARLMNAV